MADINDQKAAIDQEAQRKKDEADRNAAAAKQTAADQEAQRVRDQARMDQIDAENKARQIEQNPQ